MSDQKIFTDQFLKKLNENGFVNIPDMVDEFLKLSTQKVAESTLDDPTACLDPNGKVNQEIFEKSLLEFCNLMKQEIYTPIKKGTL